jgi:hypothetical protein
MGLFNDILSQLEQKISKNNSAKEIIADIVSTTLHTTVHPDQINVHDFNLSIKANPTIKMAMMLNKEKILKKLQEANIDIKTIT